MLSIRSSLFSLLSFFFMAVFLFSFLLPGCTKRKEEVKKETPAVPVITGKTSVRRVEYRLNQVGSLEASQEVTIRSEIEGRIVEIVFSEGSEVKKGQILLLLDAAKIKAEILNLEARIDQLQIRLANKKRTLERIRPLVERDLISQLRFDDLQTEIQEIEEEITQGRSTLAFQKERLSDTVIRAPFDGTADVRNISSGDYLKVGDSVVTIVDLDPLDMTFQVPERFKPRLVIGGEVVLRVDPYPDRTFMGMISFVAPRVDVKTRTFQVKARVDNIQGLLNPGMFARVEVVTDIHESALTAPWESIIQTEDGTYIYTVFENLARKVPVRLGKITSEWAEIFDADLKPGVNVILEGKFAVKDGARVVVRNVQKPNK